MNTPDRDSLANGLVVICEEAVAKSNDRFFYDYFTDDYLLLNATGRFLWSRARRLRRLLEHQLFKRNSSMF